MIILLCGGIGSGKSTVAEYLTTNFFFEEVSFADPLKKFALALGFEFSDVYGSQEEKCKVNDFWGISGRQFMQRCGTDIIRKHSHILGENIDNLWIKAMECKILKAQRECRNLVISDGRFEDEIELGRKYGGIVIKLKRSTGSGAYDLGSSIDSSIHESEKNFDKIQEDFLYENNKSKEELFSFIKQVVEKNKKINVFLK